MIEIIDSIFFHPVPAWILWLFVGATLVAARYSRVCFEANSRLAEEALQQSARDQMRMVSSDEWREAEQRWKNLRDLWMAEAQSLQQPPCFDADTRNGGQSVL